MYPYVIWYTIFKNVIFILKKKNLQITNNMKEKKLNDKLLITLYDLHCKRAMSSKHFYRWQGTLYNYVILYIVYM